MADGVLGSKAGEEVESIRGKGNEEWGDALRVFDVVEKKGTETCHDNNHVHDPDIKENGNQLRHRMKSG